MIRAATLVVAVALIASVAAAQEIKQAEPVVVTATKIATNGRPKSSGRR